jgi:hypothetical protein
MSTAVPNEEFIELCYSTSLDIEAMFTELKKRYPNSDLRRSRIANRIETLRKRGDLPLDSGNFVSYGEQLKGTSTLYAEDGSIKQQWVKTDVPRSNFLDSFKEAIEEISSEIPSLPKIKKPKKQLDENLLTVYISNDVHIGAYMWAEEVNDDWDVGIATSTLRKAYDHLVSSAPPSKYGMVLDLGDLTEIDDYKNMTPKSGNILDVDGRYPKILRAAYESLIYGINLALQKHEIVYFYNVAGNHDISTGIAVMEVIRVAFKDNPRVIVCSSPNPIKYHQHGTTLLQFAHGDGMRVKDAGEIMAHDCEDIFSLTKHRYSHLGHVHKDSAVDGRLCKAETHRNLAPLNHWAYHKGFRGPLGTMKSITYSTTNGELARSMYNVEM